MIQTMITTVCNTSSFTHGEARITQLSPVFDESKSRNTKPTGRRRKLILLSVVADRSKVRPASQQCFAIIAVTVGNDSKRSAVDSRFASQTTGCTSRQSRASTAGDPDDCFAVTCSAVRCLSIDASNYYPFVSATERPWESCHMAYRLKAEPANHCRVSILWKQLTGP